MSRTAIVTGAWSNIGSAVARDLATRGWTIRTLTNKRRPRPAAGAVVDRASWEAFPLHFDPEHLARAMTGADAFVNTYWIRFAHRGQTFDSAVANCRMLFDAAGRAGVGRIVQVGVSNASLDSPLGYYRGKAQVEEIVRASGVSHAIAKPTLVTGPNDVLTGNICWFLRRFPLIALPAGEGYRLQPVTLDDAGRVIADAVESTAELEIDVAGPDILPFGDYVRLLAECLGLRRRFVTVPPRAMIAALWPLNLILRDTILTREELEGLRTNLLVSSAPALGRASAIAWLRANAGAFGHRYVNDTVTRFRPPAP